MSIAEQEAVACLRILVALMKADGKVDARERESLQGAVAGFQLGGQVDPDRLLDEDVDVGAELARIVSPDARAQTYRSASFMVHADGKRNPAEVDLLERIASALGTTADERSAVDRLFAAQPRSKSQAFVDALTGLFRSR